MPKNIALLADGTGNSAAKFNRTNVWRLYQALDTAVAQPGLQTQQLAYYHDGVGTSSLRPLALLGGAFGWGLKRNLIDMYKFLCRNYADDDRIYLFGFSRGAFTVRVLGGLIAREGLVAYTGEADLDYRARDAYRAYRHRFHENKIGLVRPLRWLRDAAINRWRRWRGRPTYTEIRHQNRHPRIAFIGVFDTVAAYGTPIAELTRGIDRFVWPLSMPDYELSPKVDAARHALSLDDERDTFHPLLWDEIKSQNPGRILQVWFAGVHSDVGGGYPDDNASHIPLKWMLDEAAAAGLAFVPGAVNEIRRLANTRGPLHDSRRGLAGYYRYQPRKIAARLAPPPQNTLLMQDPTQKVAHLASVKIHQSVFERIADGSDGYAPIVLNGAYAIVARPGAPATPMERAPLLRAQIQERVWDWVWHKRINYFLTLAGPLFIGILPALIWWWRPSPCTGPQCLLAPVISSAGVFLPGFLAPWVAAAAATPGSTLLAVLIIVGLLIRSGVLRDRIRTDMRALWEGSLGLPQVSVAPQPASPRIRRLRGAFAYQFALQTLKWRVAPATFGMALLAVIAAAVVGLPATVALRSTVWLEEYATAQCTEAAGDDFATRMPCLHLPVHAEAGKTYRVSVRVTEPWSDATISTELRGFGPTRMSFRGNLLAPLRRSPTALWFQPLIKIVAEESLVPKFRIEPLDMHLADPAHGVYTAEFIAPLTGKMYFFVNDVLLPGWSFYDNNSGRAKVTVNRCDPKRYPPC